MNAGSFSLPSALVVNTNVSCFLHPLTLDVCLSIRPWSGDILTVNVSLVAVCFDFSLLWTSITISLLLIAPTRLLSTHPIWHTYYALSQPDCRLSPYRLFLSQLLILTHYLWHLISDWLGLCTRPICYNFSYPELLLFHIDSSLWSNHLRLIPYDILTPSSVSFTALYCGAQSARSPFRLFFSWLLSFTDCDTLCLTHNP